MNNKPVYLLRNGGALGAVGVVRQVSRAPRTINASVSRVRLRVTWRCNPATGRMEMRWQRDNAAEHSWILARPCRTYARRSGAMMWARLTGHWAIGASALASAAVLCAVGMLTSLFNGRGPWYSAFRQLIFGCLAAGVTYGTGVVLGTTLS